MPNGMLETMSAWAKCSLCRTCKNAKSFRISTYKNIGGRGLEIPLSFSSQSSWERFPYQWSACSLAGSAPMAYDVV